MNSETKSYEGQMLAQLVKNAESIAVLKEKLSTVEEKIITVDKKVDALDKKIDERLTKVEAKADRAEWWLRLIAGVVILSFFKEQLMSFF